MDIPEGLTGSDWEVVPGAEGVLWFADRQHAFSYQGGGEKLRRYSLTKYPPGGPTLAQGRSGRVWLLSRALARLHPPVKFRALPETASGAPLRAGYEDDWGRFWTGLLGVGLLEAIPDATWERWPSKYFRGKSVSSIMRDFAGNLIAAVPRGGLWKLNRSEGEWKQISRDDRRFKSVLPLPDGTILASTYATGVAHLSAQGRWLQQFSYRGDLTNDYREILRDGDNRVWVADDTTLYELKTESGSFSLQPVDLPGADRRDVTDLELDSSGRIYVGYKAGVARRSRHGNWEVIKTDQRIENVQALAFGGAGTGDEVWLAFQDGRKFARLIRGAETWKVLDFHEEPGRAPAETVFVNRDSRGWIWRGTKTGVYISDGRHVEPHHWLRLSTETGLASQRMNPYGFFEDSDGTVWLAGEDGVTHIHPDAAWFQPPALAPPPHITRLVAGGRDMVVMNAMPDRFPSGLKTLTIEVGSLLTAPFREAPFQYRLSGLDSEWKPMRDGTLELHSLRDGEYRLEIDHAGAVPHPSLVYTFRIAAAPFPVPWPWMIAGIGSLALLAPFFRRTLLFQRTNYRLLKLLHQLRGNRLRHVEKLDEPRCEISSVSEILANRYIIVRQLSRGGFSTVYEARDLRETNRTVAIKVFHRRVTESTWVKDRFAHEVASLRGIDHPGVVPLLESWINSDGRACLVMPFLSGQTLRDALATRPLDPARIICLIRGIGEALAAIHSRGVVHRDLKPDNILLIAQDSGAETPILVDFGNAGLIGMDEGLGRTELLTGTIDYMAPEQLTKHYSSSSDIYSFGVIILEILTSSRLSDLHHAVSEPGFEEELALLISVGINHPDAGKVASRLAEAYRADPATRPARADEWAHALTRILSTSTGSEEEQKSLINSGDRASIGEQN